MIGAPISLTSKMPVNLLSRMLGISNLGISLLSKRLREHFHPVFYLKRLTLSRTGGRVHSGIFKGMRYVDQAVGSAYLPKLLDIYERELTPQFEAICARSPRLIVNVGAGEGYYAIGLARRNPQAKIIAFEMSETGRLLLSEMARLNKVVERVEIRGKCEANDLQQVLADAPDRVIVCDVEGYEKWLLDPVVAPALRDAETHDFKDPGISEELETRFAPTHHIRRIWQEPRSHADFPWRMLVTRFLTKSDLEMAVSVERPVRMSWLWMTPFGEKSK